MSDFFPGFLKNQVSSYPPRVRRNRDVAISPMKKIPSPLLITWRTLHRGLLQMRIQWIQWMLDEASRPQKKGTHALQREVDAEGTMEEDLRQSFKVVASGIFGSFFGGGYTLGYRTLWNSLINQPLGHEGFLWCLICVGIEPGWTIDL